MILGKNIIAVNQSKEMLDLLFELDYKIMDTENGIEGIRNAIRYKPDLLMAEINTPNLNGLSIARILNTLRVRTPIILTASEEKYRKHSTSFSNVNGFMLNINNSKGVTRETARGEFESIIFSLDNINIVESEYSFSFRQHEWANLIGKSNKKKILIVEDDEAFRLAVLKKVDSFNMYDLFSAKDGLEGVYKSLLIEPDLILTDIKMPVLDGMAMSQLFYVLNKPFPIVFLSAMDDEEIRRKAVKANGVLGYMIKSAIKDKNTFIKLIEEYLIKAKKLKQSWKELYQEGAAESLKKSSENKGLLINTRL